MSPEAQPSPRRWLTKRAPLLQRKYCRRDDEDGDGDDDGDDEDDDDDGGGGGDDVDDADNDDNDDDDNDTPPSPALALQGLRDRIPSSCINQDRGLSKQQLRRASPETLEHALQVIP